MASRRVFIQSAVALAGELAFLSRRGIARASTQGLHFGAAQAFSFERLVERARNAARAPFVAPPQPAPGVVQQIDYDAHGAIKFNAERALFAEAGPYPATFFPLGGLFPSPVKIHEVRGAESREILYSLRDFELPADSVARKLPDDAGFAGFRLHETTRRADWPSHDWLAFLGASYFRSIGALQQYGLSARGVAVNTAAASAAEEFPAFTEFFLEGAKTEAGPVMVYALLDGPSLSGAFRFGCQRGTGVVMIVDSHLFLRQDIAQLGIAPMTSMFWYGEHDRGYRVDWRPEVHDSDGLAIWTGAGERLFRPLNNPSRVITSSFLDQDPHGFGLLQRDRSFDDYLDGVNYERRPSLWVEPLDSWGKGAVQLIEIPTEDEAHDNIVAFWCPERPAKAGDAYRFQYRLHWQAEEPYRAAHMARVCATRIGRGGEPGKPRPDGVTKFVVEFAGRPLDALDAREQPSAQASASRGTLSRVFVEPVPHTARFRVQFDMTAQGREPVELRVRLRLGSRAISETWLYQFEPKLEA